MFIIKSQKSSLSLGKFYIWFGKIGLIVSENVIFQLINSIVYVVYYVDACALTKSVYIPVGYQIG